MEAKFSKLSLSIFIGSMVGLLVSFMLWFFYSSMFISYLTYKIICPSSVAGLYEGGAVTYNGVPVGTIQTIKINSKMSNQAVLTLSIKDNVSVKQDTYATIMMRGLTGQMNIELSGGSIGSPKVLTTKKNPYIIPFQESILYSVANAGSVVLDRLNNVLKNLEVLLGKQNQQHISSILANTDKFSNKMPGTIKTLEELLTEANDLFKTLPTLLKKTNKELKPFTKNLQEILVNVNQFSYKINHQGLLSVLSSSKTL